MAADTVKPEEEQEETQQTGKREWIVRTGIDCLSVSLFLIVSPATSLGRIYLFPLTPRKKNRVREENEGKKNNRKTAFTTS